MATITTVPDRSLVQRRSALEHANDVRSARARLKRDVKAGRVSVVDLLADPPACIRSMRVFELLLAVPKLGPVKVRLLLAGLEVSPVRTVGGLSPGRCRVLRDALRERA